MAKNCNKQEKKKKSKTSSCNTESKIFLNCEFTNYYEYIYIYILFKHYISHITKTLKEPKNYAYKLCMCYVIWEKEWGIIALIPFSMYLLYMKALKIMLSALSPSPLYNIVVKLEGFKFIRSFLGTIGPIMVISRLQEFRSVVYSGNSMKYILSAHVYARDTSDHFWIATALCNLILTKIEIDEKEKASIEKVLDYFSDLA